ncbi:pyruvate dehydrogenase multienzyme complex, E2 component dihydrolipoyl transacetylase [Arcobacter venerupis]|uniref:Dihydrolipoamide acetyltransferase component of pyruvate dehydrogenase complex n=1 Tax=Arcobacter venerupis TaxID=1054033 RepID=A0AAE7B8T7_9BACT|nr:2-oxo acid dehydrogenase subunit E2 [Arcobacter venerupis]QKF67439.1 pyruvate dehydrogenase multienzyme complex, E2 component dihydrolipoyl transacetylase [Arcobacter venerupis]RWS50544.1 dihydrolipoamide acetyltransferase [Arcobacter venerupis]
MSIEQIKLPDVGGEEVEIIEISVKVGDSIGEDDTIIVVETEKASMDIPAPFAGTIESLIVKAGDKIKEGDLIATLVTTSSASNETVKEVAIATPAKIVEEIKTEEKTVEVSTASQETTLVIEDIFVPDVGGDESVDVIEIIASVGDFLNEEDGIITLETEKATMDVPTPISGKLVEILVNAGDKVKTGSLIARIEKTVVASTPKEVAKEEVIVKNETPAKVESKVETVSVESHVTKTTGKAYASPSIRRLAREYGVDLTLVNGTGPKNRILKDDIRLYIKSVLSNPSCANLTTSSNTAGGLGFELAPLKEIDFSKFGEIEVVELSKIQKISGPSLQRNAIIIPHVTQFDEADITDLEEFRKEQNTIYSKMNSDVKISPLVFAVKAVAKALRLHPNFNASLSADGQSMIFKKYVNVAVAVDTPNGLVVPVIKDADKKGFEEIALELKELSIKAKAGKLTANDMQGACFTISSLGGIGGTAFTPIVNAPEVAILGLSKSEFKPKYNGKEFVPRLMLPLSLSYDHRAIDGADGARFVTTLSSLLGDIRKILL